ncbi:MAG: hypothetical protein DI564_00985 [Rhodanobacter denitrificans]|uniref:Catalase-related peroxidase n=1 Tax=Rhodanobacter denitrificans TaxID=666685 RepID=A0A2W5KV11_9GAMM|nr:MAG: hypothetical protein DI564_00985 [Rhodanobacter denitrificans]
MQRNTQYGASEAIVRRIRTILGNHQGYRALHADGRLYRGAFQANDGARRFSRAAHLQGQVVPVSVRFSKGGGDPFAHFSATVGMATRFYLPDGRVTHLVMLSQKLFVASTVEQFCGLLEAAMPARDGEPLNKAGLEAFLARNPNSLNVFRMRAASPAPTSFAHTAFHAVHAFHYVNAEAQATAVRCHWVPVAGVQGQPVEALTRQDVSILFDELDQRLTHGPVMFDLVLELAMPGDPLDDATALWPEGRETVAIGRLTVEAPTTEAEQGDRVMNHDPTTLTDGIESAGDPILDIRRGVYEVSAAQRSTGWKATRESLG